MSKEKLSKPIIRQPAYVLMTKCIVGDLRENVNDEPIREVMQFWDKDTLQYLGCIDSYKDSKENNND